MTAPSVPTLGSQLSIAALCGANGWTASDEKQPLDDEERDDDEGAPALPQLAAS